MWGAIIGDLAGSIYEFQQTKIISKIDITEIIDNKSFFSDDTILTVSILDAILNNKKYEEYLKLYGKKFIDYKPNFDPYFRNSFSPGFVKWLNGDFIGTSRGNGAMMRISPVGYLFDNINDIISNSLLATTPSHCNKEAIDSATIIALIIFLARNNYSKEDIIDYLNLKISYTPFNKFNTTCYQTIDNCLYALFTSDSFNESIKKVISYGGDTDTNACIVGGMAEAMYGIDYNLIEKAKEKIPVEFVNKLNQGYKKIKKV